MKNRTAPIKKNEYYETEVSGLGHEGEGVCKVNDFTVFVPYVIPGDLVKIKILKVNNSFAFGKLEEILRPSKDREDPKCDIFEKCGGCQFNI